MKFAVSSKGDQVSDTLKSKIQAYLLDFDMELDENEPEIVISVGGDGTLLYAFTDTATVWTKQHLSAFTQVIWVFMPTGFLMKLKTCSCHRENAVSYSRISASRSHCDLSRKRAGRKILSFE